jgi:two-component system, OmpR family, sensor histidine kinase KdpD
VEESPAVSRFHPDDDRSLVERAQHDLLNPIASILGLGETIRARGSDLDDATLRSLGESIARQAARLEAMVRDLGRATRLMREEITADLGAVRLEEVVGPLTRDRVRAEVPAGLTVRADATLLGDALRRLVENALEYSAAEVVIGAGPGFIEITDQGPGFDEEGLAAAFAPLTAGINSRNERGSGLGLGLFIARKLVEAQGGTLTARSAGGKGATFRVDLPG